MMTYELEGCLEVIVEKMKTIREKHNSSALTGYLVKLKSNLFYLKPYCFC